MDQKLIEPFVSSVIEVVRMFAQIDAQFGKPAFKKTNTTWGDVTGVITMKGPTTTDTMILSFENSCILQIVSKMLMEDFSQVNTEVIDAVGELTNIICGGVKKRLSEIGFIIDMAQPVTISGKNVTVDSLHDETVLQLPFSTMSGKFVIETTLKALI